MIDRASGLIIMGTQVGERGVRGVRLFILGVVDVKEIRVKDCLDDTSQRSDGIDMPTFHEITVDPVWDIQSPVCTQRKKIMGCYRFGFTRSLQHKKLRENGDAFEPYTECPQNLPRNNPK